MNLNMNFNSNLCKREYCKYFNLRKKYLINNANIHSKNVGKIRSFPHMQNAKTKSTISQQKFLATIGSQQQVFVVVTSDHHVHSMYTKTSLPSD